MQISKSRLTLIIGDGVVLALVTLYGLASHDMLSDPRAGFMRTFLPWMAAWFVVGFFADLFQTDSNSVYSKVVRPFLGMVLASPFAGLLRELSMSADVVPIFVVVFGGISAISVAVWRVIYFSVVKNRFSNG